MYVCYKHHIMKANRLQRKEILKSRKIIERLFISGKTIKFGSIKGVFEVAHESKGVKVAFSVPKKNFRNAVDRNQIKRLLRESYRLQKAIIINELTEKEGSIHIIFIYQLNKKVQFKEIQQNMHGILHELVKYL